MANELRAHGRTGLTHYAQVYDETNQVWNGTAFVALSGATWTATAVTLTETPASSGIYLGTQPAGIVTEGRYTWVAYERAGGSPAATDTPVWEDALHWTGSSPTDLTDLPTATEAADALLDRTSGIETGYTPRQALRAIAAAAAGTVSGAGGTTVTIAGLGVSTTRVTATVDEQGNRTAVTPSL